MEALLAALLHLPLLSSLIGWIKYYTKEEWLADGYEMGVNGTSLQYLNLLSHL